MKFDDDHIVFSSGNRVYAYSGLISIGRDADGRIGPDIFYGCDGDIAGMGGKLSPADRLELADYMLELWRQFRREPAPEQPAIAKAEGYLFEPEDVARLRTIANRLGDERPLTHDQRRDLMNDLCVVIGRGQEIGPDIACWVGGDTPVPIDSDHVADWKRKNATEYRGFVIYPGTIEKDGEVHLMFPCPLAATKEDAARLGGEAIDKHLAAGGNHETLER